MANTGFKGVDVAQNVSQLVAPFLLEDSTGAIVTTGTGTLYIYELQSDGTLKSYDFSSNTFKTTALTTETASLTHQTGNNGTTNTGLWTYALATLTGFTIGAIYLFRAHHSSAIPVDQYRMRQYGGAEGDLTVTAGTTGVAYLQDDVTKWLAGTIPAVNVTGVPLVDVKYSLGTLNPATAGYFAPDWGHVNAPTTTVVLSGTTVGTVTTTTTATNLTNAPTAGDFTATMKTSLNAATPNTVRTGTAQAGAAGTITLDAGASATNNLYSDEIVFINGGTGAGQSRQVQSYVGATKVATIFPNWATNPDNTSTFTILPMGQVDVGNWLNGSIPAVNVAGVPLVDVKYILGTLSAGAAGYFGPDWAHVNAPTTTVGLSGTTVGTATTVTNAVTLPSVPAGYATSANQTTILSAVNAITTNTARSAPRIPDFMARPSSGSVAYTGDLYLYTLQGTLEDADSNTVTVHARNAGGTSLDSGLSSTTMTRISAGFYRLTYTVYSTDTAQAVYFDFSWNISSTGMKDGAASEVQDAENYAYLAAIKTQTDKLMFDGSSYVKSTPQTGVTVTTNNDKAGYALTSAEHTAISGTDVLRGDCPAVARNSAL
jgi:hypothetical protein